MENTTLDRMLIIRSQLTNGHELTESGHKNLQHIFTTWFPRVVYNDLADDTVELSVVVIKGFQSSKSVFTTSFVRPDGAETKRIDYDEGRMVGTVCKAYDQSKTSYAGKQNGFDVRYVHYRVPLV